MNTSDFNKLKKIRQLLKEAYDYYFDYSSVHGGHCKSGEGHISLEFGNYWEDEKCECKITSVAIYSYVFGSSRSHYFDSLDEALETVVQWHKEELSCVYKPDDDGDYTVGYLENPDHE
jgi:hypothetical protein